MYNIELEQENNSKITNLLIDLKVIETKIEDNSWAADLGALRGRKSRASTRQDVLIESKNYTKKLIAEESQR